MLPHRGGGGETYVDLLERIPETEHRRMYLSSGPAISAGAMSIPLSLRALGRRAREADLVHCHGDVATCLSIPWLGGRPSVMTTHGLHMLRRTDGWRGLGVRRATVAASRRLETIICTSESERLELARVLPAGTAGKLRTIHNGIQATAPVSEEERLAVRQELGVSPDEVLGIFAGELSPRKAPLLAARAAIQVRATGLPFRLAVAGEGPEHGPIAALGDDAVLLLGYRTDLPRLLGAADIFVLPSHREGLSLALLEAMGAALAVVAADGPGNPEAVGSTGLIFRAGDAEDLVAQLIRLCQDAGLRTSLGQAARARMQEHFGVERFLEATADAYREALSRYGA